MGRLDSANYLSNWMAVRSLNYLIVFAEVHVRSRSIPGVPFTRGVWMYYVPKGSVSGLRGYKQRRYSEL